MVFVQPGREQLVEGRIFIKDFVFASGSSHTGILSEGGKGGGEFEFLAVRGGLLSVEFGLGLGKFVGFFSFFIECKIENEVAVVIKL